MTPLPTTESCFVCAVPCQPRRRRPVSRRPRGPVLSAAPISRRDTLRVLASLSAAPLLQANAALTAGAVYAIREGAGLQRISVPNALRELSQASVVLAGVHHGSVSDHILGARLFDELNNLSDTALALEAVETRFQPMLNGYASGKLSESALFHESQWELRRAWPYEAALPLLRATRANHLAPLALGPDAELLAIVRRDGGIRNLSPDLLHAVIADPVAFVQLSEEPAFRAYVRQCVTPSFAAHERLGLLPQNASFDKFYTARVVADEAIAASCMRYAHEHTSKLFAVMGKERIKFGFGVPIRLQHLLNDRTLVRSVLFNPRLDDAFDEQNQDLKLQLNVPNGPDVPIADYLWFSSSTEFKLKRTWGRGSRFPPVEQLVLPENVVSATSRSSP